MQGKLLRPVKEATGRRKVWHDKRSIGRSEVRHKMSNTPRGEGGEAKRARFAGKRRARGGTQYRKSL